MLTFVHRPQLLHLALQEPRKVALARSPFLRRHVAGLGPTCGLDRSPTHFVVDQALGPARTPATIAARQRVCLQPDGVARGDPARRRRVSDLERVYPPRAPPEAGSKPK